MKMIYIDPPYNTGHDFLYNDKFQMEKEDYEAQTELFDEEGRKQYAENTPLPLRLVQHDLSPSPPCTKPPHR